ncbi:glycosyl hydrolase family 28-related protein [Tichowtungia aerotolerans]|nr:glycosyl hydrolase family 28-related protein [Tichowtungia aerotolerans]
MSRFSVSVLLLTAGLSLWAQDWNPPVDLVYEEGDGIYMLMYGTSREEPAFTDKMNAALALPYIKGIAYYQQWNELETGQDQFEWRQLDNAFNAVKQHGKKIIIGMQAGVMSPQWLIDRADVECIDFVHGNVGWSEWSTMMWEVPVGSDTYKVSRMPLPWGAVYNARLDNALLKIALRYGDESCIAFVNVCGPSVSGGVEVNFNVNWNASRAVDFNFDSNLAYTSTKYIDAWKRSIDAHLQIFSNATVGVGLHNATGSQGYENGTVVSYSSEQQMDAAEEIRDYFLQRHVAEKGVWGVVRNCGLSDSVSLWGDPDRIDDKPSSNFTALQWDVRDSAFVGYESGTVSSLNGTDGVPRTAEEFETLIRNGITGYGRHLEIKVPDIVNNPYPHTAYVPYQPVLEEAARILSNTRIDRAVINSAVTGNADWNSEIWGDPTNAPFAGNDYIHDDSSSANLLGLGDYGPFAGDSLQLDSGAVLYNKGSGDLGGTLILNGGRWDTRTYGTAVVGGDIEVTANSTVLLVDGSLQWTGGLSSASNVVLTLQNFKYAGNRMIVGASDDGFLGTFYVPDSGQLEPWTIQFNSSFTNAVLALPGQKNDAALAAVYCLTNHIAFRQVQMPDGQGGLVDLAPGTYDAIALEVAGVSTNYFVDQGGCVTVAGITSPEPYSYASWAVSLGLGADSANEDSDGDGVVNLVEYALGDDFAALPAIGSDGGTVTFSHLRRTNDAWLKYNVQTTTNLVTGDWTNAFVSVIATNPAAGDFESIVYSISTGGPARFVRLVIDADGQQAVVVPTDYDLNSVTAYGAQGNGVSDDTVAIQSAINARTAKGGGLVWFPAGTYNISSPLTVTRRISLLGEPGSRIVAQSSMSGMVQTPDNEGGVVTIENLVFDGGADQGVTIDCALDLQDFLSGRIAHVTITNATGDGIYSRWTGTFEESWVNWFVNLDIAVQGYALRLGSSDSYIDGVHVNGGLGIREELYSGNLYRNCVIENCTTGLSVSNVLGSALSLAVTDCSFLNNTEYGVAFEHDTAFDSFASLDRCRFDGNGAADVLLVNCNRVAFRDNDFRTPSPVSGQHIETQGSTDYLALTDNRFAAGTQAAPGTSSQSVSNLFGVTAWPDDAGAGARTDSIQMPEVGDVLDVKAYGAVGNGSADDTAALQAALDAARPGDTVYLPIGGYKIIEPLRLENSGITLLGVGFGNVGSKIVAGTNLTAMLVTPVPVSGVRMAKLLFVGRSDLGYSVDHAVYLSRMTDSVFDRVRFDLVSGNALVMGFDSARNIVRNCNVHHPGGWAAVLQGRDCVIDSSYMSGGLGVSISGAGGHQILNTHIDHADVAGLAFTDPTRSSTDVLVRNCYFDLNEKAVSFDYDAVHAAAVRIENSLFRVNYTDLYLRNGSDVSLESSACRVRTETVHLQSAGTVDGLRIIGNVFERSVSVPGAGSLVYGNIVP